MAKVAPFHSTRPGETVYHNDDKCTEGNNIEQRYLARGTANRPLCHRCAGL